MNKTRFQSKYIVFGFILLMMAYVLNHNERFLIDSSSPKWNHYASFKWWLLPHAITSACALFLGPIQFSDRVRRRYAKLHRIAGRIYVAGVLLGSPIGAYIQYHFDEQLGMSRSMSIATFVEAVLWMLTTMIGLAFAMKGKIQQHRQWMTRSYAVGIVFLEVRVVFGLAGWHSFALAEMVLWSCLTLSLLFADIAIHWRDLLAMSSATAKATTSVSSL
jgi:uncharacterized membrane protein